MNNPNEYRITVPDKEQNWIEFLNDNRCHGIIPEKVIIDFSSACFQTPAHITSLACLIEEYHMSKCRIEFVIPQNKIGTYLTNIRFKEYWNKGCDRNEHNATLIDTTFGLWKVDREEMETYSRNAQNFYRDNFFNEYNLEIISISLGEIFNNIYDHAESSVTGYVFSQYYPHKKELLTCVCDFGIGVPTAMNRYRIRSGKSPLSHNKALTEAFIMGVSSKSKPHNQGKGLDLLKGFVQGNEGKLSFLSNLAGYVITQNGEKSYNRNNNFPGTLIVIKLNTENLPKFDQVQISGLEEGYDPFFL